MGKGEGRRGGTKDRSRRPQVTVDERDDERDEKDREEWKSRDGETAAAAFPTLGRSCTSGTN